jgi:hypothetical protein
VSIALGVATGAAIGVCVRRARQWAMRSPLARALVPLAAAPLPDATPLVMAGRRTATIVALLPVLGGWIGAVMFR